MRLLGLGVLLAWCPTALADNVTVPYFLSAAEWAEGRQGFVRVLNHSASDGTVTITAIDDAGHVKPAFTLALGARQARHFDSEDLESNRLRRADLVNADGTPFMGVGAPHRNDASEVGGHWRLMIEADAAIGNGHIEALEYVRTWSGFLTPVHDFGTGRAVDGGLRRYQVRTFNPGSDRTQRSSLYLINRADGDASVTVTGVDDAGNRGEGNVTFTLGGGKAAEIPAQALEDMAAVREEDWMGMVMPDGGLAGKLGDGAGRWQLFVTSDQPLHVLSLMKAPGGYISNLSSTDFAPTPGSKFQDCAECPEMVAVPSGTFRMGAPESEESSGSWERPVHTVSVPSFAAGMYEVTFAEWDACVAAGGCGGYSPNDSSWGRDRRPVMNVNWADAQSYVEWLSRRTGERYRLLSESEWEYVARAGTTTPFHTGSTISADQANYDGRYVYGPGREGVFRVQTLPVGSFPANGFGLHDVHGNVSEWVQDCWNGRYTGAPSDGSAWESGDCSSRVTRGGSWFEDPRHLRSAYRIANPPDIRLPGYGFRVARTLADGHFTIPYFLSAAEWAEGRQGFVRVLNHSASDGTVTITAIDDAGHVKPAFTLVLGARQARHFDSEDLESNRLGRADLVNADGTPFMGVGAPHLNDASEVGGHWRLMIEADAAIGNGHIEALEYVRTRSDFLTPMHDSVRERAVDGGLRMYQVRTFNPGSDRTRRSSLYLINRADGDASVTVTGVDDAGNRGEGNVTFTLGGGKAAEIPAQALEDMAAVREEDWMGMVMPDGGLAGKLGDGAGRWQLFVTSDQPLHVLSLMKVPGGYISNLSTTTSAMDFGPPAAMPASSAPDLVVASLSASDSNPEAGAAFTLSATVRNDGDADAPSTTLRWLRSSNSIISNLDTEVGTDSVGRLAPSGTRPESIDLTAPSNAGTYYYGACVAPAHGESDTDTDNNCSTAVRITVRPAGATPDLVVASLSASDSGPEAGAAFTLSATVRNDGDADAPSTTLRWLRSSNSVISNLDTEVGTESVGRLAPSGTSPESIGLTAPSSAGTYYYGACVAPARGETDTDTDNNCSTGVRITVRSADAAPDLVVTSLSASDNGPQAGTAFTLSATVRNDGDGDAPSTTLRWLRSSDATISTSDTQVGTDSVDRLVPSGTSGEVIGLTAPPSAGTYYYGACVAPVSGETETGNNCSTAVRITVRPAGAASDLVVASLSASDSNPEAGAAFTLSATVRNDGDADAGSTILRWLRSPNSIISNLDTEVGTDSVPGLAPSGTRPESIDLTAPSNAGTYYYGACVTPASGETEIGNNCSTGVRITVRPAGTASDLVVVSLSASDSDPEAGAAFTLSATVRNDGDADAPSTTLRWLRSSDATISTSDTEVGTDSVPGLAPSGTRPESINLTAPSSAGTYYYGACVAPASGETETGNNCSTAVRITVRQPAGSPPDLVVESPSVSDAEPDAGASFALSVVVRNQGNGRSSSTMLRYYRSNDAGISRTDTEVGAQAVAELAAAARLNRSTTVTAPDAGTFYYGACVDAVAAEADTGNNCSSGVRVSVAEGGTTGGGNFDLAGDNDRPTGITYANGRFYVVDEVDDKVYAYATNGQRDAAADFDLAGDNGSPHGIVHANGRFYVADYTDDKVYAYATNGQRDAAADFDLTGYNNHRYPYMAHANGRFYVVDFTNDKVYAYATNGQRDAAADFDLAGDNGSPSGIVHADGRLYVPDYTDDKVYAYATNGQRDAVADFDLDGDNDHSSSIAHANGWFYVVDEVDDKVYAYNPPNLVVSSLSVSDDTPDIGTVFQLRATVSNRGKSRSAATTLRYYRSDDGTISVADSEVGSEAVDPLDAAGAREFSIEVTAPSVIGTYYYGACVDAVFGESASRSNCSPGVLVRVGDDGTEAFDLAGENSSPTGIAHANGRFYVVDFTDDKVYVYATNGQRDAAADFDLDGDNGNPFDIAHANGRFYVVDNIDDDKVYAYATNGQRDAAADFDLAGDNGDPTGIAHANGRFYVVDWNDDKVYAYATNGQRDAAADFDLDGDNGNPFGIAHANGRFYVVDWNDDKVYAYATNGQRDAAADFDLDGDNSSPVGIAHADGRFYVVDNIDDEVYGYSPPPDSDGPDLVVQSPSTSEGAPEAGESFTFSATVRNRGNRQSPAATLRWLRSSDSIISNSDTEVGTDSVPGLAPSGTSPESIDLTAPSSAGTYYYGACVAPASGETETGNNCSTGVRITVGTPPVTPPVTPSVTYERLDLITVSAGRVRFSFFSAGTCISLSGATLNGVTYSFVSSKWQTRANSSSAWSDIAGTERTGQLCSYNPSAPGEYRLVAEITIDGETGHYASNTITRN